MTRHELEDPDIAAEIAAWPTKGSKQWYRDLCEKIKVSDESWNIIEDVIDLRRGILFNAGGKGDQPYRWWTLVRYADQKLAHLERKEMNKELEAIRRKGK